MTNPYTQVLLETEGESNLFLKEVRRFCNQINEYCGLKLARMILSNRDSESFTHKVMLFEGSNIMDIGKGIELLAIKSFLSSDTCDVFDAEWVSVDNLETLKEMLKQRLSNPNVASIIQDYKEQYRQGV